MGIINWVRNRFSQQPQQQGSLRARPPMPAQNAWVLRIEGFAFQAMSVVFSLASAYAILQVFVGSSIDIMHLDIGRYADGLMLAVAFGAAGYFLSRSIAYRLMAGQMAWSYILPCAVVELVEIYCNYMVGVSELHLNDFLREMPADQHSFLILLGRIVMSSIPAMTLTLSVAHMDYEMKKVQTNHASPGPSRMATPQGQPLNGGRPGSPRNFGNGARQAGQPGQAGGAGNPMPGVNPGQTQPAGARP